MTFVKGQRKPPNAGRRAGTPNKRTVIARTHPDALDHLAKVMASTDPLITPELKMRAAIGLAQYQHPKPGAPREATFNLNPFKLNKLTTLEDAGAETLRVAVAVASGELDHDTGQFLVAAIRAFVETLAGVKTEKEIAAADALRVGGRS
jgi:hypothetical protein